MQVCPHYQLKRRDDADDQIRIVQFTDMHLFPDGATAWTCTAKGRFPPRLVDFTREAFVTPNAGAVDLVESLIASARPHLVLFTGDIVDGRPFGRANSALVEGTEVGLPPHPGAFEGFRRAFAPVLEPLLANGISWCFCPGNHDDDGSPWTRTDLLQIFQLPGCATPSAVRFDHTLTVGFGATADSQSVRLWIFDSGPNRPKIKYEPVAAAAVAEYERLSTEVLPACAAELAYVHVPLPEYAETTVVAGTCALFEARLRAGMVEWPWRWVPRLARWTGRDRAVGCSKVNTGLVAALSRQRRVCAVSCVSDSGHSKQGHCAHHRRGVTASCADCPTFDPRRRRATITSTTMLACTLAPGSTCVLVESAAFRHQSRGRRTVATCRLPQAGAS